MPKRLAKRLLAGFSRPAGIRVQHCSVQQRLDDYAEALALAEAGELVLAGGVLKRSGTGRKRILVLGHGAGFSDRLADYSLGLARRLGYGLVFLNVGEPGADPQPSAMASYMREGFALRAGDAVRPWLLQAAAHGIEAGHVVRFGDAPTAVEAVCRDLHRVELILSDPEEGARLAGRAPSALFTVE